HKVKRIIIAFALVFVAGILAGGVYEWLSTHSEESTGENASSTADEKAEQTAAQPENGGEVESAAESEDTADSRKAHVTNADKQCSTPGCGRAVFVTYKGKELCVKCYGDLKNEEAQHE
ncbi:MAG TPA: hypothetical protein VN626_01980, partial [Clostridia bacterium]|nr:hypothetical protein [Clostridia bacterium]